MAGRNHVPIEITTVDDLFKTEEQRQEERLEKVQELAIADIDDFPNHPFHVVENDAMREMTESVKRFGVLTPAVVRRKEDGRYELLSGHRRKKACELAGIEALPAIVREMSRDEAIIFMVDSNLQREHILPSEKAFSYKMKLEAIKRQGERSDLTSAPLVPKLTSREQIAEKSGDSHEQVRRYIRLTELIRPLLELVDNGKIAFRPAVELSYLPKERQTELLAIMQELDCTPSLSQAQRMKQAAQNGRLDKDGMERVMNEEKPNQREQIRLSSERVDRFFPKGFTPKQKEDTIIKLLSEWQRKRERARNEPMR